MDWYTMTPKLIRDQVVQGHISMVWTERFNSYGDFQLNIPSTKITRALYQPGTMLCRDGSQYGMTVETYQDATADDGSRVLTLTGRSWEATILGTRPGILTASGTLPASLAATPTWNLSGPPATIMRNMFNLVCIESALQPQHLDALPFIQSVALNQPGSLPEPSASVTLALNPDNLYNQLVLVAQSYDLGFRLIKGPDNTTMYFEVYTGDDHTSTQTARTPVIFATSLDNLADQAVLKSIAGSATVAYVFAQNGTATVYATGTNVNANGFNRRVLVVDASDITLAAGTALNSAMLQRGYQELQKNQAVYAFGGQVPPTTGYVFGIDYKLGDIVEERDSDNQGTIMRVTEQIFASDSEGDRSYPTLTAVQSVLTGSWDSIDDSVTWASIPSTATWATG